MFNLLFPLLAFDLFHLLVNGQYSQGMATVSSSQIMQEK